MKNVNTNEKCDNCIGKLEYKTAIPCRYCKWNTEDYFGKRLSKMIQDNFRQVKSTKEDSDIPY